MPDIADWHLRSSRVLYKKGVLKDFAKFTGKRLCQSLFINKGRSSRPKVFCKKGVLGNFAKFTGKHLCQSLFFNKVAGGACNFIKKETLAQVFSCEFCEISKNTFSQRTPLVGASQENACARVSLLIKAYNFIKKETGTVVVL